MSRCDSPEFGKLLHAYELGALSEEDTERFETHLIDCDVCYGELLSFEKEADILNSDNEFKRVMMDRARGYTYVKTELGKFLKSLWPDVPFLLKPAVVYLIALLMIVPAYWRLKTSGNEQITPLQTVSLLEDRSVSEDVFRISSGEYGLLEFLIKDAAAGKSYSVEIRSRNGEVIYQEARFSEFDIFGTIGTGRLLLPVSRMGPGDYELLLTDLQSGPRREPQRYYFRIEK